MVAALSENEQRGRRREGAPCGTGRHRRCRCSSVAASSSISFLFNVLVCSGLSLVCWGAAAGGVVEECDELTAASSHLFRSLLRTTGWSIRRS